MKRTIFMIIIMVMFVGVYSSSALAAGTGFYLNLGTGSGDFEYDTPSAEFNLDSSFYGIGFLLETNPVTPKNVFSYRFQVGLEGRNLEFDDGDAFEMLGLLINNTFAFGGNVSNNVRLWAGPQIMVGLYDGESDYEVGGEKVDIFALTFGVGIAGGVNISVDNGNVIIPVTLSLRRMSYAGQVEWWNLNEDVTGQTNDISITVGLMF